MAVVGFVHLFDTCEQTFVQRYVVLVPGAQLLYLLFDSKNLVVAACIDECVECAYYNSKPCAGIVELGYCVLKCCLFTIVAYLFNDFVLFCYALFHSRNKVLECDAVIRNGAERCLIRCEQWIHLCTGFFDIDAHCKYVSSLLGSISYRICLKECITVYS